MKTLLLFDANSIIHRSFHALPPFTGPDGQPTGAIYGIASILLKLWREERPDYAAALFDRPEPTFRDKIYAEYKAQRAPAASELIAQIIEAHHLFEAFGIKTFEMAGYEADDLIATFAEKFKNTKIKNGTASGESDKNLRVVILTGDRDTLQLVEDEKVYVRNFNKGISDTTTYNEKAVFEKYSLRPDQLVDYKALVGDSSDNIKGVPGIGPKRALELIQKFGTIENLYAKLTEEPKLQARLAPFKKEAELSKQLVVLERNVPIEMPKLEDLATSEVPLDTIDYFQKMGFATLMKRFENSSASSGGSNSESKKPKKIVPKLESGKKEKEQGKLF
jgi:DNA polymerase-1